MFELRFDEKKCLACRTCDCLTKCQYMEIDKDTAKTEIMKIFNGEDSFVLHNCLFCYISYKMVPFFPVLTIRSMQTKLKSKKEYHMVKGTIRRLIADRGFGFIQAADGTDLFFHRNELEEVDYNSLTEGQQVEFEIGQLTKPDAGIDKRQ